MTQLSPTGTAALGYAARGWAVFPLRPRDKTPACAHGVRDATTDIERIRRYWLHVPAANVGIATGAASGFWVLDVDGPEAAAWLAERYPPLPATRAQVTARGRHLLFVVPGVTIRNSAGRLGPGLDVRGEGGYIVAAPSVHPSGHVYAWCGPDAIAETPPWLVEALTVQSAPSQPQPPPPPPAEASDMGAIAGILRRLARAKAGERNNLTYWAAHRLRERGVRYTDAQAALTPIAEALGLPVAETRRTVASAYREGRP